ncbi:MAG: EscU/YscU/HrcU family type III secretion system export apparatus switch protein [Holosporales bacterium]|jgi:flagellar biosynthetic protein FlhB|nr:EscU/YscU/HrcU family type III secretion system export apparatus switch protein [Holosporales bacterium]
MPEEQEKGDASQKSFEATEYRLRKAREEGKIPISRDLGVAIMIAASAFVLLVLGARVCVHMGAFLTPFIEQAHRFSLTPNNARTLFSDCAWHLGEVIGWTGGVLFLSALLGSVLQTRFIISWERLKWDVSKLSLKKGVERLFSWKGIIEFLKSILKFLISGLLTVYVLKGALQSSTSAIELSPLQWLLFTKMGAFQIFLFLFIFMLFFGGADYAYQWFTHRRDLRMTHQEMKEEFKQQEGNPQIRAQIRRIQKERAQKSIISTLQEAAVLITDASRCTIALRYGATSPIPVVTAKGTDAYAQTLCELGLQLGIPVVEEAALARTLYAAVPVEHPILSEHYQSVAGVIRRISGQGG